MKVTLAVLAMLVTFIILPAALGLYGLEMKRFFAPRHAEIDRQVFEQTPSFVHGKAQYIARLRAQYTQATSEASRNSLRILILDEASVVDRSLLPANLQAFLNTL